MKEYNHNLLFYCYSSSIKKELMRQGFMFATKARHLYDGQVFWLFIRDDKLNRAVEKILQRHRGEYIDW